MAKDSQLLELQAEAWAPQSEAFGRLLPVLAEEAAKQSPYAINTLDDVGIIEIEQANGVAYVGAVPHTDKVYDQWFLMFVVAGRGTRQLHTADTKKVGKNMTPNLTVDLEDGKILLFDAHKVHWVDMPDGLNAKTKCDGQDFRGDVGRVYRENMSVLIGTELTQRPTREQAEEIMLAYLRNHTPKCWNKAGLPLPEPEPKRARARFGF